MITVGVLSESPLVRECFTALLSQEPKIRVIISGAPTSAVVTDERFRNVQVVLLVHGAHDTDTLKILRSVHRSHRNVKVVVVSLWSSETHGFFCLKAGAAGYISNEGGRAEVI